MSTILNLFIYISLQEGIEIRITSYFIKNEKNPSDIRQSVKKYQISCKKINAGNTNLIIILSFN